MDGMAQASHEFVSHNYAPFNAAIAKYVEKLEQPDPRIAGQAFREKARGVGHVLRALGVAAVLNPNRRFPDRAVSAAERLYRSCGE